MEALTDVQQAQQAATSFCGTYHHQVDVKGRVAVPAALRRGLAAGSVVAPSPDRRLMIWPPEQWEAQQERFRRTAETAEQERRFLRTLVGNAYPFETDAQGRLLLSSWQRTWAAIDERAVFVGMGAGVEIAGYDTWQAQQGELDPDEFTRLHDLVYQRTQASQETSA